MMQGKSTSVNDPDAISRPAGMLPTVAGFYFAFRIFTVLLAVRVFGLEQQTGTAINLGFGFLLVVATVFCVGEGGTAFPKLLRTPAIRWAVAFLAFSCCSLLWSGTASLAISVAYWCGMASDFAVVALLLRARPGFDVAESLMSGYVWGACAVAGIAWLLPAQSDLRLGDEELLGPNGIAYVCAFAFFFAQYLMRTRRRGWKVQAVFLAITVLRCLSKTTIVALLVSQMFLLMRDTSMRRRTKLLMIVAGVLVIGLFSALLVSYFDIYSNAGNQSETLSGRLGIWWYFLTEAVQQPWIGHGFDSVRKVVPPFGPDQFEAAHAHNELLQQFYAYGAAGVILMAGVYFSFWRQVTRLASGPVRTFFLSLLIFVLVRGLADTEWFDLSLPLWAVLLLSTLIECVRTSRQEARSAATVMPVLSSVLSQPHAALVEGVNPCLDP